MSYPTERIRTLQNITLRISVLFILLVLPIIDICACQYCSKPNNRDLILLAILHAESEKTKAAKTGHALMPTYFWCPLFALRQYVFSFCIFWIGHSSFGFFRVARWCVLPVAWRPDIDVLSLSVAIFYSFCLSPFLLYDVRIDGITLRVIRSLIVVQPGSVQCTEGSKVKGSQSPVWCSVHTARPSLPQYVIFPFVDTPYTKHYAVYSGDRYSLY